MPDESTDDSITSIDTAAMSILDDERGSRSLAAAVDELTISISTLRESMINTNARLDEMKKSLDGMSATLARFMNDSEFKANETVLGLAQVTKSVDALGEHLQSGLTAVTSEVGGLKEDVTGLVTGESEKLLAGILSVLANNEQLRGIDDASD